MNKNKMINFRYAVLEVDSEYYIVDTFLPLALLLGFFKIKLFKYKCAKLSKLEGERLFLFQKRKKTAIALTSFLVTLGTIGGISLSQVLHKLDMSMEVTWLVASILTTYIFFVLGNIISKRLYIKYSKLEYCYCVKYELSETLDYDEYKKRKFVYPLSVFVALIPWGIVFISGFDGYIEVGEYILALAMLFCSIYAAWLPVSGDYFDVIVEKLE